MTILVTLRLYKKLYKKIIHRTTFKITRNAPWTNHETKALYVYTTSTPESFSVTGKYIRSAWWTFCRGGLAISRSPRMKLSQLLVTSMVKTKGFRASGLWLLLTTPLLLAHTCLADLNPTRALRIARNVVVDVFTGVTFFFHDGFTRP